jgi:hypothetical protein
MEDYLILVGGLLMFSVMIALVYSIAHRDDLDD